MTTIRRRSGRHLVFTLGRWTNGKERDSVRLKLPWRKEMGSARCLRLSIVEIYGNLRMLGFVLR